VTRLAQIVRRMQIACCRRGGDRNAECRERRRPSENGRTRMQRQRRDRTGREDDRDRQAHARHRTNVI
jgi:hypothetical protein